MTLINLWSSFRHKKKLKATPYVFQGQILDYYGLILSAVLRCWVRSYSRRLHNTLRPGYWSRQCWPTTVVWPLTDCPQRRLTYPTSLHRQSACSPQLAITWRRCVCRGSPTVDTGAGAAVRRWRRVPVLRRYTPVAGGRSRATANGQPSFRWSLSTLVWCRVSHGEGEDSGDLSGCTGAHRPRRRGHGGGGSSVVRGNCCNRKLLRSDRPRYRHATPIQAPCGRKSTHYWRRHHLDHRRYFSWRLGDILQLESELDPCCHGQRPPRQCSTHARRRLVCHCSSQWPTDEVRWVLRTVPAKHCSLDPVPTWLVKKLAEDVIPVICHLCSTSLECCRLPDDQKLAVVRPGHWMHLN